MKAPVSKTILFISIAIAVGLPCLYAACLGAGFEPVGRIAAVFTERRRAPRERAEAPPVPEPPESKRYFHLPRGDGAFQSYYESALPRDRVVRAVRELMTRQGWKVDEAATRIIGEETRGGERIIFRARGWRCDIFINELHGGSDVTVSLQPVATDGD